MRPVKRKSYRPTLIELLFNTILLKNLKRDIIVRTFEVIRPVAILVFCASLDRGSETEIIDMKIIEPKAITVRPKNGLYEIKLIHI